jgi:hypothetical protein
VYESDYIMRIIQQMGVMLRAMKNALAEQQPKDVTDMSREALQLLLGIEPTLAESLTTEGLVALLSAGGAFDAKRGRLAAEVYVLRVQAAASLGDFEGASADFAKAERLIALVLEHGDLDDGTEATALVDELRHAKEMGENAG